jgi:hypothetical protein
VKAAPMATYLLYSALFCFALIVISGVTNPQRAATATTTEKRRCFAFYLRKYVNDAHLQKKRV